MTRSFGKVKPLPLVSNQLIDGSPKRFRAMTAEQLEAKAKAIANAVRPKLQKLPVLQAGSIVTDGKQRVVGAVLEVSLNGDAVTHRFLLHGKPATAAQIAAAMPSPKELGKWAWWVGYQLTQTHLL
jgi:hypothetical protein